MYRGLSVHNDVLKKRVVKGLEVILGGAKQVSDLSYQNIMLNVALS